MSKPDLSRRSFIPRVLLVVGAIATSVGAACRDALTGLGNERPRWRIEPNGTIVPLNEAARNTSAPSISQQMKMSCHNYCGKWCVEHGCYSGCGSTLWGDGSCTCECA